MKEIYAVLVIPKGITGYKTYETRISQECYEDKEKAIDFCKSRLNKEELENHEKQLKRNLISWYEFEGAKCRYEIKVLSLK